MHEKFVVDIMVIIMVQLLLINSVILITSSTSVAPTSPPISCRLGLFWLFKTYSCKMVIPITFGTYKLAGQILQVLGRMVLPHNNKYLGLSVISLWYLPLRLFVQLTCSSIPFDVSIISWLVRCAISNIFASLTKSSYFHLV